MNGEYLMDWECGYYDRFEHELREGNMTLKDVVRLYKDGKITEFQYQYGMEYLAEV